MDKKYFFFDIDGTLTNRNTGEIIPSAQETLKKLKENGHFVCIATGRAHYKAKKFALDNGISNMVCNGGAGIMVNGELISNKPLDYNKALAVCNEAISLGYGLLIATNDSDEVLMFNDDFIKQVGYRKEPTTYIYDTKACLNDIKDFYKIYVSINKSEESLLTLKDTLPSLRFVSEYLMFQHDSKDKGILAMMEYLGGNLKDVVVFGDDDNDLVMFKKEWTSIAMGNACDALKEKASFITKDNIDDGIKYACEYYNWL